MPPEAIRLVKHGEAAAPVAAASLAVAIGQYSSAGAKAENQDFHGTITPEGSDLTTKGVACAIADGISTSRRGAEAAETAVKSFLTDYYCTSDGWAAKRAGECVIAACNSWMHAHNMRIRPREEGAGREAAGLICTLSALVLKSRSAHIFHIGDSRIARLSSNSIEPLTTPHQVDLGGGQAYLGRALGVDAQVEIEYRQVALQVGDLFILSTDGVHEYCTSSDIKAVLSREVNLDAAALAIAELARSNGSPDNLTIQLVRINALPRGEVADLLGAELRLSPPVDLKEGDVIDGYELLEQLHGGNRSQVWRVRHPSDSHDMVMKVPATDQRGDPAAMAALMLEEWVLRRLAHPNLLASAPSHGERSAAYALAAYLPGQSLHKMTAGKASLPLADVRAIIRQISAGLEAMHRRGMLHRDLRPHNVMVGEDGHATIIDFGSVHVAGLEDVAPRAFEDAAYAGTFQFSAPELYLGHAASVQSDVFSLGVIAYQLLTGELPYGTRVAAANTAAAQRKLAYCPASQLNPDLPDWVDAALVKAVAIDPNQRYESPAELVQDLANPNRSLPLPMQKQARLSLQFWRAAALLLLAALSFAIFTRPDLGLFDQTSRNEEARP